MKIGIVGYGNLGRAAEINAKNLGYEITGIFSRRNVTSPFGTKVFGFKNFGSFDTETDIMLLCGGSKTNLREQSRIVAKRFNTADTFDTHAEIAEHIKELDDIQQKRRGVSITAAGWDPGIFSVARVAFCAFLFEEPYTIWGRGASQGHGEAVRSISGVKNAVQYTVPKDGIADMILSGKRPPHAPESLHTREVYVVKEDGADEKEIENKIKNTEYYFKGYETSVRFIDEKEFEKNHNSLAHGGRVIATSDGAKLDFSIALQSNPDFTAKILLTYARAAVKMNKDGVIGGLSVLDVPPKYLCHDDDFLRFL